MDYTVEFEKEKYIFDGDTLRLFKDNKSEINEAIPALDKKNRYSSRVVIYVASKCNARCVYCYETQANKIMTEDSAKKTVDYLAENYDEIAGINFFGGEPLLNYDIIKYIVENLENRIQVNEWKITTNITLLTDEMIEFFEDKNFKFTLSFDGPKDVHNSLRKGCEYELVVKNINKLKKSKVGNHLEINCTCTQLHNDMYTRKELKDFLDQFEMRYFLSKVETDIDYCCAPLSLTYN